ncbi:MAG: pyrroloquinoline quinone biosynthesis protein PqqE [Alphaproteobacteria bacterium]|nr:pyrroloquinoline quinone biosynthesis protein PqqE [Alphaproteobacteria bacterium]
MTAPGPPIGILAELTHRCPLQCPYCSNPVELLKANRELSTETWIDILNQAADLGVLQVHLSGGEPTLRQDLEQLVSALSSRSVYTNLITAGINLSKARIQALKDAGLDHVQLSIQGATPEVTELIGKHKKGFAQKMQTAEHVRACGLPLTVNAPIHRHNIHQVADFIELALALDADRLEIANVQYYGWAYLNRAALLPALEDVERQVEIVEKARDRLKGILNFDFVTPDYYADYPKPCMGGWAKDAFVIVPDGTVLPCHAAQTISGLSFENAAETPLTEIWETSPTFEKYRGFDWMSETCKSCPRKELDHGGCRCQAFAVTGDAAETDPACILSPHHDKLRNVAVTASAEAPDDFSYRRL